MIDRDVLRVRLESLVLHQWGVSGVARPHSAADAVPLPAANNQTADAAWLVFLDGLSPCAVGLRIVDAHPTNPRYELIECGRSGLTTRSLWRFNCRAGWRPIDVNVTD